MKWNAIMICGLMLLGGIQGVFAQQSGVLNVKVDRDNSQKSVMVLKSAIRENALEAKHNAGIYQWQRVNREVDRIVADARRLEKLSKENENKEWKEALQSLRAARLHHNSQGLIEAADRLVSLCNN